MLSGIALLSYRIAETVGNHFMILIKIAAYVKWPFRKINLIISVQDDF